MKPQDSQSLTGEKGIALVVFNFVLVFEMLRFNDSA
jgi:hypothetical protein